MRTASTSGMPTSSISTGSIWLSNVELPAKVVSSPINMPTPSRTSYAMPPMVNGEPSGSPAPLVASEIAHSRSGPMHL